MLVEARVWCPGPWDGEGWVLVLVLVSTSLTPTQYMKGCMGAGGWILEQINSGRSIMLSVYNLVLDNEVRYGQLNTKSWECVCVCVMTRLG